MNILLVDHHKTTAQSLLKLFPNDNLSTAISADKALAIAHEYSPDIVILELSLAGHSGLEFLYEFRTYTDWKDIPVIIYSTVQIGEDLRSSRAWMQLNITNYIYKPDSSLDILVKNIEKATTVAT